MKKCTPKMELLKNIFTEIQRTHGIECTKIIKKVYRFEKQLAANECRLRFLLHHRQKGIYPNFISGKLKIMDSLFKQVRVFPTMAPRLNNTKKSFLKKLLSDEIAICNLSIKANKKDIKKSREKAQDKITEALYQNAILAINTEIDEIRTKTRSRQKRKLYRTYEGVVKDTLTINQNFCVNLSKNQNIPTELIGIAGLGKKYAIRTDKNDFPIMNMLLDTEHLVKMVKDDEKELLKGLVTRDFIDFIKEPTQQSDKEKQIMSMLSKAQKFMKANPDVYVMQADKGQKTVIMDKHDYEIKMGEHLADTNTYEKTMRKDIFESIKKEVEDIVMDLYLTGRITGQEKHKLCTKDCTPPRIYGTIKTHKDNHPIRPVVSNVNTYTAGLSKYINDILNNLERNKIDIKNSEEFKLALDQVTLEPDDEMVSFDVVALYTSIPQNEGIECVMEKWEEISQYTNIPKAMFRRMLELCIKTGAAFLYKDDTYIQKTGLAMGNSLAGTVATMVLNNLLEAHLNRDGIKLILKYVDDLGVIINKHKTEALIKKLNAAHASIKFTYEKEVDGKLPYLDILMIRDGERIKTNWYQKEIASGRILDYTSAHQHSTKMATATSLAMRALKLSSPEFKNENMKKVEEILLKNNYPRSIVRKCTEKAIRNQQRPVNENPDEVKYKKFTYVPILSEKIQKSLKSVTNNIKLGMSSCKNLQQLIFSKLKTKLPTSRGHIYKISCKGNDEACDKIYIGETKHAPSNDNKKCERIKQHISANKRALKEKSCITEEREQQYLSLRTRNRQEQLRLLKEEHHNDDMKKQYCTAALTHAMRNDHTLDYDNVDVLHYESTDRRRKALEALYIQRELPRTMNLKMDTQYISTYTKQIIHAHNHQKKTKTTPVT